MRWSHSLRGRDGSREVDTSKERFHVDTRRPQWALWCLWRCSRWRSRWRCRQLRAWCRRLSGHLLVQSIELHEAFEVLIEWTRYQIELKQNKGKYYLERHSGRRRNAGLIHTRWWCLTRFRGRTPPGTMKYGRPWRTVLGSPFGGLCNNGFVIGIPFWSHTPRALRGLIIVSLVYLAFLVFLVFLVFLFVLIL